MVTLILGFTANILKNIRKKSPTIEDDLLEINTITQKAYISSMTEKKLFQARFFFNDNQELIACGYGALNKKDEARQTPAILSRKKIISSLITIKDFIVNEKDELKDKTKELWILFFPEGFSQEASITIKKGNYDLKAFLNPFNGLFELRSNEHEKE